MLGFKPGELGDLFAFASISGTVLAALVSFIAWFMGWI